MQDEQFSSLDRCRYMRRATTEDGTPGWALFDSAGELELFHENRNIIWFYITEHELKHVWLN